MDIDEHRSTEPGILARAIRRTADGQERLIDVTGAAVSIGWRWAARRPLPRPDVHLRAIVDRLDSIAARRFGGSAATRPLDPAVARELQAVRPDLVAAYRRRLTRFVRWELAQDRAGAAWTELERAARFFGTEPDHAALLIACRIVAGQGDEALNGIEAFQQRFGCDPVLPDYLPPHRIVAIGNVGTDRRSRRPAVARAVFRHVTEAFPDNPTCWWLYVDTLIHSGCHAEAEAVLDAQTRRFPDEIAFVANRGVLALKRGEWDAAIAQFQAYLARDPDSVEVAEQLARARMERNNARVEAGVGLLEALRQDVGLEENEAVRTLLLRFESLGSDCEFGLVQRRFGAEPMGLFRWNATHLDRLIEGLSLDLEGLGEPANTEMSLWNDFEYFLSDRRWGFGFHTFTSRHEVAADDLYPKMVKRLAYLRQKFLLDLREGRKTCVFKARPFDEAGIRRLHAALRRHGPTRLLCVVAQAEAEGLGLSGASAGSVHEIAPDLHLGIVSRFGDGPERWDVRFDEWIALCRQIDPARTLAAA